MSTAGDPGDARAAALTRRADFALAVLAGIATIGFAWTGYQSASWLRERFERSDLASEASVQAVGTASEADRIEDRDTLLYAEWVAARQGGDRATAEVLFELFGPELQAFVDSSGSTDDGVPLDDPLDDPDYDANERRREAAELEAKATQLARSAEEASSNAARYGGIGVTFTAILAATGIALRFRNVALQRGFVAICSVLTVCALVLMVLSPIRFG